MLIDTVPVLLVMPHVHVAARRWLSAIARGVRRTIRAGVSAAKATAAESTRTSLESFLADRRARFSHPGSPLVVTCTGRIPAATGFDCRFPPG